jgi:hypothetical protein
LTDDEWSELFAFQVKYRKHEGLSGSELMIRFELPLHMRQYLYSPIPAPSKRSNSQGLKLRELLQKLNDDTKHTVLDFSKLNISPTFVDDFCDFCRIHWEALQKVGIIRLFRKGRILRVYTSSPLENQEILTVLQSLDQSKFPDGTDIQATNMIPATF